MKPLRILSGVLAGIVVALALGFLGLLVIPRGTAQAFPHEGWTPLRDDGLARAHLPGLRSRADYGSPVATFYRAARAADGSVYIGYHFVWDGEANPAPGLGPALSRAIYTGGLSLQRLMFGKGDVELIVVELGPDGAARAYAFEEALDYDPASFSVTHAPARHTLAPGERAVLEVMSWNHLFRALPEARPWTLPPRYHTSRRTTGRRTACIRRGRPSCAATGRWRLGSSELRHSRERRDRTENSCV